MVNIETNGRFRRQSHFSLFVVALAGIIFAVSIDAFAAPPLLIDADAQYAFAQKLFQQQDYDTGIAEFQRFIHFFPQDDRVPEAEAYIGQAQLRAGQYKKAIRSFETLIDKYEGHPQAVSAFFHISDCFLRLEDPQQAIITLQNLARMTNDPEVLNETYYRMGWIAIDIGKLSQATGIFKKIGEEFSQENGIDALIEELSSQKPITRKNPTLAGMLSIVPGTGQLYCGRYRDALSAFIVNGGLIWAAVESFEKEFYALGATITFFEFGFYTGNIYGAMTSAHKYNQRQIQNNSRKLRKQYYMGLLPIRDNNGIMLSFQYVY